VSLASQYQDWSDAKKLAAKAASEYFRDNIVSILNSSLSLDLEVQVLDVLLAGSFGSRPGYGSIASDFDVLLVLSNDSVPKSKQSITLIRNVFNTQMMSRGFEHVSNVFPIIWQEIKDRTNYEGSLDDVTATSLIDGKEFIDASDFHAERFA
jgi:hypothetical protein